MKKINIKILGWSIVILALVIAVIILVVGLTSIFVRASGRFNLPVSWILSPSGVSVDLDNNGIIDNVDSVPSGLIAMFDTDCPSGWTRVSALDGKFLVGGASYNSAAGGNDSITLAEANLPSHTHGSGTLSADSAGSHYHSVDPPSKTTSSAGSHTHSYNDYYTHDHGKLTANGSWGSHWATGGNHGRTTGSAGSHTHTVNIGAFNSASAGAHTHTISGSTGATGSGTAFDNRPAYATIVICKKN